MRRVWTAAFLLFAIATAAPDFVVDFSEPLAGSSALDNDTIADDRSLELVKRQSGCRSGYSACINLNAPGLCCEIHDVCSRDAANNVACCPVSAACTGTIRPVVPTGAPTSASSFAPGTTPTSSFVFATTTTNPTQPQPTSNTFVQSSAAGSYIRSTVPNTFYPFPYIPTTYTNAAACSRAYTSCQADAMSCTSALANGVPGVTVTAPNGGATITAIASLGSERAASVCASLSSQACSGLIVEACASFGNGPTGGARTLCGGMYGVGAGVAVGIAGQLLR